LELEAQKAEEKRKYQEKLKAVCVDCCFRLVSGDVDGRGLTCALALFGSSQLEQRKIESKHMVADIIKREEAELKAAKAEEVTDVLVVVPPYLRPIVC
jgi:hypothetical protein